MKYLLIMLSAVLTVSSAAATAVTVSYSSGSKDAESREANYDALVTAEALKSAILNDQKVKIRGLEKSQGINYKYSSVYYGNQKVSDSLPQLINKKQGAHISDSDLVATLYAGLLNGGASYDITRDLQKNDNFTQSIYDNITAASALGTKQSPAMTQPDSATSAMLAAIVSGAKIIFGNNFTPDLAETFIGLLNGKSVSQAAANDKTMKYFTNIDNILTNYSSEISSVLESITQSNAKPSTLGEKLSDSTNNLFKALIYFVTKKKFTYDGNDAPTKFWDYVMLKDKNDKSQPNTEGLTPVAPDSDDSTFKNSMSNTVKQVANIADFVMTLIHYFRAFDNYEKQINSDSNGAYLFDGVQQTKTNGEIKKQVLSTQYLDLSNAEDGTNDYWFQDGQTHYMKLNLQNLFSDLSYWLNPSGNGYQPLRIMNTLLGGVSDGKDADGSPKNVSNPFVSTAIKPLIDIIIAKYHSAADSAMKIVGAVLPGVKNQIDSIINNLDLHIQELLDWLTTDNGLESKNTLIVSILNTAVKVISSLINSKNVDSIYEMAMKFAEPSDEASIRIILSALEYIGDYGTDIVAHPWTHIYSEPVFKNISKLYFFTSPHSTSSERQLGSALKPLGNIKSILLQTPIDDLVLNAGKLAASFLSVKATKPVDEKTKDKIDALNGLQIPDWLYSLKDQKISALIWKFTKDIYKNNSWNDNLKNNKSFLLSTEAISSLVSALLPHKSDDGNAIRITKEIVDIPNSDNGGCPLPGQSSITNITYSPDSKTVQLALDNPIDAVNKDQFSIDNGASIDDVTLSDSKKEVNIILSEKLTPEKDTTYTVSINNINIFPGNKNKFIVKGTNPDPIQPTTSSVSAIMPLFYSIRYAINSDAKLDGLKVSSDPNDTKYYTFKVQLPGDSNQRILVSPQSITYDDSKSTGNVNKWALNYILGLSTDGRQFSKGSFFQGLSQLYGHNFNNDKDYDDMTRGAQSVFSLASEFSTISTDSISELVSKEYEPYLDKKNWKVGSLTWDGLNPTTASASFTQHIRYRISYHNIYENKTYIYSVELARQPYNDSLWKLTKLKRLN